MILVAEDHPSNQEVLRRQLASLGYECKVVGNGLEAQRELDGMGANNRPVQWDNARKWHYIEGAVSWLKGETTEELGKAIATARAGS